jgi:hypothetical protein
VDRQKLTIVGGALLIIAGVLFLLDSLAILQITALIWALIFAAGGLAFLTVFVLNRAAWWPVIPGFALLGLAVLILVGAYLPDVGAWAGSIFLGAIALGFWVVYLLEREQWWAIIPGGVLVTLALVAGLAEVVGGGAVGGLFFFGIGATFALLAVVPTSEGRLRWAWIPAIVMVVMGFVVLAAASDIFNYVWPAALILGGIILLLRVLRPERPE